MLFCPPCSSISLLGSVMSVLYATNSVSSFAILSKVGIFTLAFLLPLKVYSRLSSWCLRPPFRLGINQGSHEVKCLKRN